MRNISNISRRALLAFAAASAFAASAITPAMAQEVLRLHHFNSPRSAAQVKFLEPWAKAVTEASNGTLEIQIYPSMQLGGKQRDLFSQVRDGVVDLAYTSPGFTPGELPALEVFELPFVATTNAATAPAVQEYYEKYMADSLEKGYRPLVFHTSISTALHTTKKVEKPEDLEGLRLRAPNRVVGDVLAAAGAGVVNVAVPDLTQSIDRGLIDGTPMAYAIANILKIGDVTKYHTDLPLTTVVFMLMINEKVYEALPAEAKASIDANSGLDWSKKLGKIWDEDEVPAKEAMVAAGGEVITPDAASMTAFETLAKPAIDDWIANTTLPEGDTGTLYQDAVDLVKKYAAE
ncbi:TRAP transporter substrate-binding protein [Martelella endophytica]|uniref:TRAP transporter substrate-binding protein n=1 Tax=Martelella endophytica TaxID=1486262 RepID=UPI000695FA28|nr:TRAP transporter substrate-binding protein [Martelella endophytica]